MRRSIELAVNGQTLSVDGEAAFLTLSSFLRDSLGLVGTKIVCSEGDCGACSVLVGRPSPDQSSFQYKPIDSCIAFLYQLDRTHIVTVEGLGDEESLSPVQNAMVACHGSQCGYCTPGFVTTLHGIFEEAQSPATGNGQSSQLDVDHVRVGLSGNLCRCTGYVQIIDAARSIAVDDVRSLNHQFPPEVILDSFDLDDPSCLSVHDEDRTLFVPKNLDDTLALLAKHPNAKLVSGATDLGVQHNHGRWNASTVICLTDVGELQEVSSDRDEVIIGAGATWTDVIASTRDVFPELADLLLRFGSPQIRNFGTIGGNLVNASPIADSIPFLYVIDAQLELTSAEGTRNVSIEDFYQGYKQIDLRDGELLRAIRCPRIKSGHHLRLYKVSKRRDMDISTFTAAILVDVDSSDMITEARIAFGGVGPTVIRARKSEAFLVGRDFTEESLRQSGEIARTEITPIADVRGSIDYRLQLAENVLLKFFHDVTGDRPKVAS